MDCSCSFCESLPLGENRKSSVRRPAGFAIPPLVKLIEKSESPIDSFSLVIKKNILYFA